MERCEPQIFPHRAAFDQPPPPPQRHSVDSLKWFVRDKLWGPGLLCVSSAGARSCYISPQDSLHVKTCAGACI